MPGDTPIPENGSRLDRIERAIEFLASHAATVDGKVASVEGQIASVEGQISSLTDHFGRLFGVVQSLAVTQAESQRQTDLRFQEVSEKFISLSEKVENLADKVESVVEKVDSLADAQLQTDGHISALVAVVDGMIRRPPPAA